MGFLVDLQLEVFFQLLLAGLLGALVGLEREARKKEAGLRTYSLVCLGSALFTILGLESALFFTSGTQLAIDPSRIVGQIVLGIGFLGGGLIIFRREHVEGLTTAAGLWVVAAIGATIGLRFYLIALFACFLTLAVLAGLRILEIKLFPRFKHDEE